VLTPSPPLRGGPPPGWYPDPWHESAYRWWNGTQWTPSVHPHAAHLAAPQYVYAPAPKAPHQSATFAPRAAFGILAATFLSILLATSVGDHLDFVADWLAVVVVYVVLFGAMYASVLVFSRTLGSGSVRKDFGLAIKAEDIGWGALAFAGTMVGRIVLAIFLSNLDDDPVRDVGDSLDLEGAVLLAFAVAALVGAPIVEELVFRGVLQRGLTKLAGAPVAIGLQAVLFSTYHFVPDGSGYSHFYFGALVVFGIGAGIAVDRTGRLGPGIVAHAINNAVAVTVLALG
jgi:membrane protease YdiL (CAAX protease family)